MPSTSAMSLPSTSHPSDLHTASSCSAGGNILGKYLGMVNPSYLHVGASKETALLYIFMPGDLHNKNRLDLGYFLK